MMKRYPTLIIPVLLLALFPACKSAAPDTNLATRTANANTAKETFNPVAIEAEIIKLEKDWASAAQRHDADTVRKIFADDLVMTYPDGSVGTKESELSYIASGAMTAESWELLDPKVTVMSPDAVFITGRSVIKNGKSKDSNTKRAIDISGEYRFTDVYARRNGQWLAVASQTTQIANPAPAPSPSVAASPK